MVTNMLAANWDWGAIGAIATIVGVVVAIILYRLSKRKDVAPSTTTVNDYFGVGGGQARFLLPPDLDEPSIEYETAKNFYAQRDYGQARKYFQLAYDKQQKLKGLKDKDTVDYLARLTPATPSPLTSGCGRRWSAIDHLS